MDNITILLKIFYFYRLKKKTQPELVFEKVSFTGKKRKHHLIFSQRLTLQLRPRAASIHFHYHLVTVKCGDWSVESPLECRVIIYYMPQKL